MQMAEVPADLLKSCGSLAAAILPSLPFAATRKIERPTLRVTLCLRQKELDEGIALVRQHKRDAAITFLRAHTKSHPERWWLAGVLSSLLFTEGNYQEAYNYANAALQKYKGYFQSRLQIYTVD
jgi:predicted Zn-dependent protease